jgi:hypothetical protein
MFGVSGIPLLHWHVLGKEGEKVKYFKDKEIGGEFDIGTTIRKQSDSKSIAKVSALELYKTLETKLYARGGGQCSGHVWH